MRISSSPTHPPLSLHLISVHRQDDIEEDEIRKKERSSGLEDSDDDDDEDDEEEGGGVSRKKKLKRVRDVDVLDEDDLDLINEATRGEIVYPTAKEESFEKTKASSKERDMLVKGRNVQELSRGLFTGDTDDESEDDERRGKNPLSKGVEQQRRHQNMPERYDEDGLDDFIEDDVDDDREYAGRSADDDVVLGGGGAGGVSESMLQEHLDIFGSDFMDFMGEDNKADGAAYGGEGEDFDEDYDDSELERKRSTKYRERGVGVDYGLDSGEELEDASDSDDDDDDADLFGDDDVDDEMGDKQRADILKLKRDKKRLAKEERRRQHKERAEAKRKAALRRAFEPVQLVENFCTERDDAIRIVDSPERFYDWLEAQPTTKRMTPNISDEITEEEEEEAFWIMRKIPAIHSEWSSFSSPYMSTPGENAMETEEQLEKREREVLSSIVYALRYMRAEKLEPEFIRRYRQDVVSSPAVRSNLYRIVDEDSEWERMTEARSKIENILANESQTNDEGEELFTLRRKLQAAAEKLQRTLEDEERIKVELEEFDKAEGSCIKEGSSNSEDNDDDDLFGDDDEEEDEVVSCLFDSFS